MSIKAKCTVSHELPRPDGGHSHYERGEVYEIDEVEFNSEYWEKVDNTKAKPAIIIDKGGDN